MKLFVVFTLLVSVCADRLTNNYLPPYEAQSAGGSPGSIYAPIVELARSSFSSHQNQRPHQRENDQIENYQQRNKQREDYQEENNQSENYQIKNYQNENNQRENSQRENNQNENYQRNNYQLRNNQRENTQSEKYQGENDQRGNNQRENKQRQSNHRENNQNENYQRENDQRGNNQRENNQRQSNQRENNQSEKYQRENYQKGNILRENNQRINNGRPQNYNNPQDQSYILRQNSDINDQGYYYAYETSDGTKAEQEGNFLPGATDEEGYLTVHGSYSYLGDDGQTYSVRYVADENGYRLDVDNSTPPPFSGPIFKSQQVPQQDEARDYDSSEYQKTNFNTNIGYSY